LVQRDNGVNSRADGSGMHQVNRRLETAAKHDRKLKPRLDAM